MPNTPDAADDFNPYTPESLPAMPPADETPERPRGPDGRFLKSDETPAPKIPPSLARQARQVLGLTDEDLADMTAAEVRSDLRFHTLADRMDRVSRVSADDGRSAQAAPSEPTSFAPLSADETDYEALVKAVNALAARMSQYEEAAQQIPKMAQYLNAHAQQEQLSFADEVDEFFAQHPETYGVGTYEEVDQDSLEFGFREKMIEVALKANKGRRKGIRAVLERLHAKHTGQKPAQLRRAAQLNPPQDEPEDETDRLYASGRGVLGRPTQRNGGVPATGLEGALRDTAAILDAAKARTGRRNSVVGGSLNGIPE